MDHVVGTIRTQLVAARDKPQEPSRVFIISTYVIGKERILLAVRLLHTCIVLRLDAKTELKLDARRAHRLVKP